MNRFIDKKGSRVIALLLAIAMLLGSTVGQTTAIASGQDAKAKETLEFDNREEKEDVEALKDDFIDSETSEKVDKEAGASTDEPTDIVSAKDDVTKPDEDNQMPLEQPNEDPKVVDEGDTKESESVDETTDTIVEGKDDSDLN
ncbi:MAG: hypothetical protein GXY87_05985, partial [Tissierellia bacterium]|nr:hypothetical protein [Tissierellia bacterium]